MSQHESIGSIRTDPRSDQPNGGSGRSEAAGRMAEEAQGVASTAMDAAREFGAEATDQVRAVADQARSQLRTLADQASTELRAHADSRSQQATTNLRTLADRLDALASGRTQDAGPLVGYLYDAKRRALSLADRLETRGPDGMVEDVSTFARRRPGLFLLAAAGAGLATGRIFRAERAAEHRANTSNPQGQRAAWVAEPDWGASTPGRDELTGAVGGAVATDARERGQLAEGLA